MSIQERLEQLGLELPQAPPPGGVYKSVVVSGGQLYVSGQPPRLSDGSLITGKVGRDLTMEEGKAAARQVGLTMLATIAEQLGGLDRIMRLVKTFGMVNCFPEFDQHPQVINGFSELMRELLGEDAGLGARSAVGMSLPGNIACEIEAIFELE